MNRRNFMGLGVRGTDALAALPQLQACGGSGDDVVSAGNSYRQSFLVTTSLAYKPLIVEPGLANARRLTIRPAVAGGHVWVTARRVCRMSTYST